MNLQEKENRIIELLTCDWGMTNQQALALLANISIKLNPQHEEKAVDTRWINERGKLREENYSC